MIIMKKTKLEDIASFDQLAPRQIERLVSDEFELCFSVDGTLKRVRSTWRLMQKVLKRGKRKHHWGKNREIK